MVKKFLIYGLQDPNTNEIRYIGRSSSGMNRPRQHLCKSVYENAPNYPVYNWIRKSIKNNFKPKIVVIQQFDFISNSDLNACEMYWINYYKQLNSPLLNLASGGGGCFGYKWSENQKEKLKNRKSRKLSEKEKIDSIEQLKAGRDKIGKEEFKRRVSSGTKKWWETLSPEKRKKCSGNLKNHSGKNKISVIDSNGIIYQSLQEAANSINCSISSLSVALKKNKPCKGMHFRVVKNGNN